MDASRLSCSSRVRRLSCLLAIAAGQILVIQQAYCGQVDSDIVTPASQAETSDASKNNVDPLSPEFIAAQLKELDATADADLPEKAKLVELYRSTADDVKLIGEHAARCAEFEKKMATVADRISALQCAAADSETPEKSLPAAMAALSAWEQRLADAEQQFSAARKASAAKDEEPQRRARRRLEIPQAIAVARTSLEEIASSETVAVSNPDEPAAIARARSIKQVAQRRVLETEIAALEKELQWYDGPSGELLKLEREAASRASAGLEQQVSKLRDAVNERRRAETDRQASEAHLAAITADPSIRRLADENSALAEERKQLGEKLEVLGVTAEAVRTRLDELRKEYERMTAKVKAAGLTNPVGQMLRKQRSGLSSIVDHLRAIDLRHDEIAEIQLKLFDLEERLAELRDPKTRAGEICKSFAEACAIEPEDLQPILAARREYLESLQKDYNEYFRKLVEVDSDERLLVDTAEDYRNFIEERVLWIRSATVLSPVDVKKSIGAFAWLGNPKNWWDAWQSAVDQGVEIPALVALIALGLVPWMWMRRQLRRGIRSWARPHAGAAVNHSLRRALQATVATLLIAVPVPVVLWLLGWFISGGSHVRTEFCEALGGSLQVTALVLLPLLVSRQICRPDGLAEAHFGWPAESLRQLRHQLGWLSLFGAPLVAVVAMLEAQTNDAWKESLGRALFLACQVLLAVFLFRSLRPPNGSMYRLLVMRPGGWLERLAVPLYMLLCAVPVLVGSLAAAGYYYTALRLAWRLELTLWLVIGLIVVQSLLARWLTAIYRRLAIEAAVRSAGLTHTGTNAQHSHTALQPKSEAVAELPPEVDLERVDLQTKRLLHSIAVVALVFGLGCVWSEVLPALQILNEITLWAEPDGNSAVTLANLLNAVVAAVMTFVAVNNLPGLLEAIILHRLPLDAGVRYAVAAVVRYSVGIAGITIAAGAIGIGWPKVQWLVAAVTFGLGFGLQEIFANFVSGLIVLFERPVRVGDTVTVGDLTGVVSRIRMRATTITDWDRKELIIPNKEFITGKLVNWTLSDSVIRLVIPIGIAYGSDTERARQLLLKVAADTRQVQRDPVPKAFFMGFGDSVLNFELRVFVANVDQRVAVMHELNMAIDRVFREAGIEIAFPQRDIHIRSIQGPAAEEVINASLMTATEPPVKQRRNAA